MGRIVFRKSQQPNNGSAFAIIDEKPFVTATHGNQIFARPKLVKIYAAGWRVLSVSLKARLAGIGPPQDLPPLFAI